MLLFLIGLEVRPQRLWVMRRAVFGLGTAQVAITGAALAALAHCVGVAWPGAVVLGAGLAMSSTAIVLPMLAERDLLHHAAPAAMRFAVLLFQDLAFIPLVAAGAAAGAATACPTTCPGCDVARARGGHRRHPGRRPLPAAPAVPRHRRRARRRRCSPRSRC